MTYGHPDEKKEVAKQDPRITATNRKRYGLNHKYGPFDFPPCLGCGLEMRRALGQIVFTHRACRKAHRFMEGKRIKRLKENA